MNKHLIIKSLILAAATTLGATMASAQSANVAVPTPSATTASGLLGSRYTEVTYKFIDFSGNDDAHGFTLGYNQPLSAGFDFVGSYEWAQANLPFFVAKIQDVDVGVKAFSAQSWGKPYVLAAVGWEWQKAAGFRDSSFTYKVGFGAEFQVAPAFTLAPYVNFHRATGFDATEYQLGVQAAYRLDSAWSLTARVQRDLVRHDDDDTVYSIGAAFHF